MSDSDVSPDEHPIDSLIGFYHVISRQSVVNIREILTVDDSHSHIRATTILDMTRKGVKTRTDFTSSPYCQRTPRFAAFRPHRSPAIKRRSSPFVHLENIPRNAHIRFTRCRAASRARPMRAGLDTADSDETHRGDFPRLPNRSTATVAKSPDSHFHWQRDRLGQQSPEADDKLDDVTLRIPGHRAHPVPGGDQLTIRRITVIGPIASIGVILMGSPKVAAWMAWLWSRARATCCTGW